MIIQPRIESYSFLQGYYSLHLPEGVYNNQIYSLFFELPVYNELIKILQREEKKPTLNLEIDNGILIFDLSGDVSWQGISDGVFENTVNLLIDKFNKLNSRLGDIDTDKIGNQGEVSISSFQINEYLSESNNYLRIQELLNSYNDNIALKEQLLLIVCYSYFQNSLVKRNELTSTVAKAIIDENDTENNSLGKVLMVIREHYLQNKSDE